VQLVAGAAEHSHVLHAMSSAADAGVTTRTVPVDRQARVAPSAVADVLASAPESRSIVVLQTANQEVGTRQPVDAVAEVCAAADAVLVLDASVTAPWEPLPDSGDVLVVDAASWGGPRSVAAAIVRSRRALRAPATPAPVEPPAVPELVMAATALHLARATAEVDAERVSALVDRIRAEASASLQHLEVLGDPVDRAPHLLTLSLMYVAGEAVVDALGRRGVMVGSGSACTSDTLEPSHVLAAMGALTHGNVRLGLEPSTSDDDVALLLSALPEAVAEVRAGL
jgi:cysteine desulfurase